MGEYLLDDHRISCFARSLGQVASPEFRFIADDDESSPTHSLGSDWAFRFVILDRWGTQDAEFDAAFAQNVRANDPF